MHHGKELLRQLKAMPWRTKQEAERYARTVSSITPTDLQKALEFLVRQKKAGQNEEHQLRCIVFLELGKACLRKPLFLPYIRALKTADGVLRQTLAQLIPLVNSIEGHEELCGHLRSSDASLRKITAQILKEIGGKTVMGCVHDLVKDSKFAGFDEAMGIARHIGGFRFISILGQIVLSGPVKAKVLALRHLGNHSIIGHNKSSAAKAIKPALRMTNDPVIEEAIRSYAAMSSEAAFFQYAEHFLEGHNPRLQTAAIESLKWFRSSRAIVILTKQLQSSSDRLSRAALSALETMGDETILPAIVQGLSHNNISVRSRAHQALLYLSENNQIDITRALLWLLRSDNVQVRRQAVDLARSVKDPHGAFWPKLLNFLQDEDWWVREQVTEALLELAGMQLTQHIVPYARSDSPIIRRWALEVLGRIADPQTAGLLVQIAQQDTDWWVREKAIEALAALGDSRVTPYILELLQEHQELQWSCLQALAELRDASASPYILPLLHSGTPEIQLAVLDCMEAFNAVEHAGQVMTLLDNDDPEVARTAFSLLNRWEAQSKYLADGALSNMGNPLDRLLIFAYQAEGEDLILAPNRKAYIKRHGKIQPLSDQILSGEQLSSILIPHLHASQMEQLDQRIDLDFSYEVHTHKLRFRAHLFHQDGGLSAVFRHIDSKLASFDKLGLPEKVRTFGQLNHGLVIFGGPTGSGKSTTLAAIIDDINRHSNRHIISLEDPIEVLHDSKHSLVNQREIGSHTLSFDHALRAALRQDPDVILVGEMRDLTTISLAITAAETGHLVFGTLHTVSAETTIDRLINAFPSYQQEQVRSMLAQSLRAVVCQYLLKRKDKPGRCLASEVMVNNDAISNLIRKSKQFQISSMIATFREQGMQLMDHDLMRLYEAGMVYADEVYMKAKKKKDFEKLLEEGEVEQRHRTSTNMSVVVGTTVS